MAPAAAKQRKKWTEEEERCLLRRYSELQLDGSLSRLRTREKKFTPIADHVNSAHHRSDPAHYPHLWSWKDASTKVQNMRHQYLLVKQKIVSAIQSQSQSDGPDSSAGDFSAGASLWPNFLLYKEVFGDAPLPEKPLEPPPEEEFVHGEADDGEIGLGFEEENGFDYEEAAAAAEAEAGETKKRRRTGKRWRWRRMRRREEEWEERMERRREEWRQRVEGMLAQHRSQMADIQARVVAEQQSVVSQLLGIVSHWASSGPGSQSFVAPAENAGAVPEENTGEDHQFIVEDG